MTPLSTLKRLLAEYQELANAGGKGDSRKLFDAWLTLAYTAIDALPKLIAVAEAAKAMAEVPNHGGELEDAEEALYAAVDALDGEAKP